MLARALTVIAVVLLVADGSAAQAQSSGGSFGGGGFGGGSSGGSGSGFGGGSSGGSGSGFGGGSSGGSGFGSGSSHGSSSSGSRSSGMRSPRSSGSSSRGSPESDDGSESSGAGSDSSHGSLDISFLAWPVAAALAMLGLLEVSRRRRRSGPPPAAWEGMDVAALTLAIDWRARRFVQSGLDRLARTGRTGSNEGLAELLAQTASILQAAREAWLYAGIFNQTPQAAGAAEKAFRARAADARSRYRDEVVRNADGTVREREAEPLRARSEEGEGVVVVTLVVAGRREIQDIYDPSDPEEVAHLLAEVGALGAGALAAMEVIWSPAAEQDRMSTAELERHYPELLPMRGVMGVGRVFCDHCAGPYAAELGGCPHCGAPQKHSGAAS